MAETGKKSFFDKPVETPAQEQPKEEVRTEPVVETPKPQGTPEPPKAEEKPKVEEPKKFSYLADLNKDFQTDFKTPEDFKGRMEKARKADEYEPKITEYEKKEREYKEQLEKLQSSLKDLSNPLSYFTSQESYVAEQLRRQHPDKSPMVLQEVVTSDNKRMDDLDVLVKDALLNTPGLKGGEQGVKETILSDFGVDINTPKEEWPISVQNKIMMKANAARKGWDELKATVQLPKVVTPEEREAERVRLVEERKKVLSPLRESFSKFDKFTEEIDEGKVFDFNVPDEYKELLPEMFDTYLVNSGIEPTEANLKNLEDLKKGLMLLSNFKQIYKTIEGDVTAREKAKRDELLGNNNPSNTKSGLEIADESDVKKYNNEHGLGKLLGKK